MLDHLPPELLCLVFQLLPQTSVNQISLTCHSLHATALPRLYATVVLSFRTHIRQLESALQNSDNTLKYIIQQHTKELVLKCKQSGQHRLLFDSRSLLSHLPHLQSLSLVGFHMLPVDYITPILSLLPRLHTVSLRYCDLIANLPPVAGLSSRVNLLTFQQQQQQQYQYEQLLKLKHQQSFPVTTLEFYWTDFSKSAIESILSVFPSLTGMRLLANHNRHFLANNYALDVIQRFCPQIMDLEIGLQEVKERALVDCIKFYGDQLRRLSIRYHGPLTLFAITKYASSVQDLTVRFSLETKWYATSSTVSQSDSPSITPTHHRLPRLPYTTARSHSHQHQQHHPLEVEQEIQKKGALLSVLCQCQRLVRVQVESMRPTQSRDHLPLVIRNALEVVAQKRITLNNNCLSNSNTLSSWEHRYRKAIVNMKPMNSSGDGTHNIIKTMTLSTNTSANQLSTTTAVEITPTTKHQRENKRSNNNNSQLGSDSQQHQRRWGLSTRMGNFLVLDYEQLMEIRSQALPFA